MSIDDKEQEKASRIQKGFVDHLGNMLSKHLKIPVFVVDPKIINEIFKVLNTIPEINSNYSEQELKGEISEFIIGISINKPKDESEFKERIINFTDELKKEKEYEAILLLHNLIELPIGLKIGPLEIVDEVKDEEKLLNFIKSLEDKRIVYSKDRSWAKLRFKSYSTHNVREDLYRILELPYGILSLIMNFDLDVRNSCGGIYSKDGKIYFLEPRVRSIGWSKYIAKIFDKYLGLLSKISQKDKLTKLENKIIQSIQLFWLSRVTENIEIRFLITMASLENLLLTKNDRDYLGLKLAEKSAFLLENEKEKRIYKYKLMKKFYKKRSDLIHSGRKDIDKKDEKALFAIYRSLVFILLELSQKYEKMEQKSHDQDKEGVEDYLDQKKFS